MSQPLDRSVVRVVTNGLGGTAARPQGVRCVHFAPSPLRQSDIQHIQPQFNIVQTRTACLRSTANQCGPGIGVPDISLAACHRSLSQSVDTWLVTTLGGPRLPRTLAVAGQPADSRVSSSITPPACLSDGTAIADVLWERASSAGFPAAFPTAPGCTPDAVGAGCCFSAPVRGCSLYTTVAGARPGFGISAHRARRVVAITSTPPAETDSHRRRGGMSAGYGWST